MSDNPKPFVGLEHLLHWLGQPSHKILLRSISIVVAWSLLVIFFAYALINNRLSSSVNIILAEHNARLSQASLQITQELSTPRDLIRMIYGGLNSVIEEDALTPRSIEAINQYLVDVGASLPHTMQLRWLDISGKERIRVDFPPNKKPQIIPEKFLQDKSHRYYFTKGISLPDSRVYISAIDLNEEHKQVEVPYRPTIRVTMRTGANKLPPGLLVLNYDLTYLHQSLSQTVGKFTQFSMVNAQGYWMINPNKELEWGWQLGNHEATFGQQQPAIWAQVSIDSSAVPVLGFSFQNHLLSWLFLDPYAADRIFDDELSTESYLYLMAETSPDIIRQIKWDASIPVIVVAIFLIVFGALFKRRVYLSQINMLLLNQALDKERLELSASYRALNKAYEQQLQLQGELVETRKLSALGLSVAGVAHEINTPAGGVRMMTDSLLGLCESLREKASKKISSIDYLAPKEVDTKFESDVENIEQGLILIQKHADKICSLVRSYKRLAVERMDEEKSDFSLKDIVDDILVIMRPRLKVLPLKITTDIDETIQMSSYAGIISQTLQNLIENALSHGFSNSMESFHRITVAAKLAEDNLVEITVTDNGVGIPEEKIEKIFDPFESTGRGRGHSGLGLYLVHQWVVLTLKGHITVTSVVDEGTTFTLKIPLTIAE